MKSNYAWSKMAFLLASSLTFTACGDGKGDELKQTPENDTIAPTITLKGAAEIQVLLGTEYKELGATAEDNVDGTVAVTISGSVDTNVAGDYTISYSSIDKAGNSATVTRKVTVQQPQPFITTWDTSKPGVSNDNQIKIDTLGEGYNYSIDWGDGNTQENVTDEVTHTYAKAGVYTVKISGQFPHFYMKPLLANTAPQSNQIQYSYQSDNSKLQTVEDWGTMRWRSMHSSFRNTNVTFNTSQPPYLANVKDMSYAFACDDQSLNCALGSDVSAWDVSTVTNMEGIFANSSFNGDVSKWNVAKLINASAMFAGTRFFNQDIGNWSVAAVTNMSAMFDSAQAFNQNIGQWKVDNVTNMSKMFSCNSNSVGCNFDQNISAWNVAKVTDMSGMFAGATSFNQDIGKWDVSSVTNMASMFQNNTSFNQDLRSWKVAKVSNMARMFQSAQTFNQDISGWDVANVSNMSFMFSDAIKFNQDISKWNTAKVTDTSFMFSGAVEFNQDISAWNVANVTDMSYMFSNARRFNQNIATWNVANVTGMSHMFYCAKQNCSFNQNLADWNITKVQHMWQMFTGVTLSTTNYSNTLQGWSNLQLQKGVNFHGGNSKYSALGRFARINIIDQFNWVITDGGFDN